MKTLMLINFNTVMGRWVDSMRFSMARCIVFFRNVFYGVLRDRIMC